MTTSTCTPIGEPIHIRERELRPDHLGELLGCLADLVVATGQQRRTLERLTGTATSDSTQTAIERLAALEDALRRVGPEAAAVHQLLQREHLI